MDAKEIILAGAIANAELMVERDRLREGLVALKAENDSLRSKIEALEAASEDEVKANPEA